MARITLPEDTDLNHLYVIHTFATDLLEEFGLIEKGWTVVWDRSKKRAGQCRPSEKHISLSAPLMAIWTLEQAEDTIRHEIAHALTLGHGHDRIWKLTCLEVGADPTRCWGHNGEAQIKGKYVGCCPNGHLTYRNRWTKNMEQRKLGCRKCSPRYDKRYLFTWSEA